jgi:hypothetical protein
MLKQLDAETNDLDLTSFVLALTHTPDSVYPTQCQVAAYIGDGSKNLDGTGGTFKMKIMVGAYESPEIPFTITSGDTRVIWWSDPFPVIISGVVKVYLFSPNGADTDVGVTVYLYDVDNLAVTPNEPTTVETTIRGYIQQLWRRFFKKTTLTSSQLKTFKDDASTVVTTQSVDDDGTTQTQGAAV